MGYEIPSAGTRADLRVLVDSINELSEKIITGAEDVLLEKAVVSILARDLDEELFPKPSVS